LDSGRTKVKPLSKESKQKRISQLVLLNIQGLKYEKMQFIKDEFKICKNGTLMAITETWLKKDVCNAEFLHQFENHDIVRCDRHTIKKAGTGEDGEKHQEVDVPSLFQ